MGVGYPFLSWSFAWRPPIRQFLGTCLAPALTMIFRRWRMRSQWESTLFSASMPTCGLPTARNLYGPVTFKVLGFSVVRGAFSFFHPPFLGLCGRHRRYFSSFMLINSSRVSHLICGTSRRGGTIAHGADADCVASILNRCRWAQTGQMRGPLLLLKPDQDVRPDERDAHYFLGLDGALNLKFIISPSCSVPAHTHTHPHTRDGEIDYGICSPCASGHEHSDNNAGARLHTHGMHFRVHTQTPGPRNLCHSFCTCRRP